MSLRSQVLVDVKAIIENTLDWGQAIALTDPAGVTTNLTGLTGDISRIIDPDSGLIVKGKQLHVTLFINSLPAGSRPEGQGDLSLKPWLVSFNNISSGTPTQYVVLTTDPDDSMGTLICELGEWKT